MSRVHGFLGIDSSLKQNVACLRINDRTYRSAFDNDQNGHAALIAWAMKFAPQGPTIGVEATGNYHKDLAWAIRSQGLTCLVLNPRQVRDLAKGLGVCKTDKTDAEVISRVLEVPKISCQAQRSKVHDELRDISREIQSLTELKSDLQRRLKGPCRSNAAKQADAALIAVCKAQIARLEREWMRIVKTTDVLHESYKLQL